LLAGQQAWISDIEKLAEIASRKSGKIKTKEHAADIL
jgi:hypothetical protein